MRNTVLYEHYVNEEISRYISNDLQTEHRCQLLYIELTNATNRS